MTDEEVDKIDQIVRERVEILRNAMAEALRTCQFGFTPGAGGNQKPLRHEGLYTGRYQLACVQSTREKAFHDLWVKENTARAGVLSEVLSGLIPGTDQSEATAVATVIQWLGSNGGFCFLEMALSSCGYMVVERKSFDDKRSRMEQREKAWKEVQKLMDAANL